ncbi:phosphotransferase enzyme family protein [Neobacillus notoginsengisoli]|nr:phosphotransferase [Neobacillus notoginsengisoli]
MTDATVLISAANAYGLDSRLLIHVGGYINDVYQYTEQNGVPARIIRLTKQTWRNQKEVLAELHFMKYLFDNGVSVPDILPSKNGNLVESVEGGYLASMFTQAPGRIPIEEDWNREMVGNWGRIVGQMHLLTQSYVPLEGVKRRDWKQEPWMDMMRHLPHKELIVRQKAVELLNWLETLPKDKKNYGLVHCDLYDQNFFVAKDGTITAFDFDDCCYHWFAFDVAIILYLVIARFNRLEKMNESLDDHVAFFLDAFLKGYQEVNHFENWWLKAMPHFLRYRRLLGLSLWHQRYDWKIVDGELKIKWLRLKAEIEADKPLTNYPF